MRVFIVIALLVGARFMILFVLANLARELSRQSFQAPPDLDSSDDWDVAVNDFTDPAPPVAYCMERRAVSRHPIVRTRGDDIPGNSNALDDLRSAL
jgi:hypothetical protein